MSQVQEYDNTKKSMTPEELQRSVERLTRVPERHAELKPLVETKTITNEQLQARIKHLYDDSLARRAMEKEEIARQMQAETMKDATLTTHTISPEEEEAMVARLYDESIARKAQNMEALYQKETSQYVRSNKTISRKQEKEAGTRLYEEGMQRERDKHNALYEKFVVSRRTPTVYHSSDHIACIADKMTKGEGSLS